MRAFKNPFSIFWICTTIVIAIIGFQLFTSSAGHIPVKYDPTFFYLAEKGFIQDAKIINKERLDFTITKEGKNYLINTKEPQFKSIKQALTKGNAVKKGDPVFELNIVDAGNIELGVTELNKSIKEQNIQLRAENKTPLPTVELIDEEEVNYLGNILKFIIAILILIVIWRLVKRRISIREIGGANGLKFNIEKEKANQNNLEKYGKNISPDILIPETCPNCKSPNSKKIRICEWCGNQII